MSGIGWDEQRPPREDDRQAAEAARVSKRAKETSMEKFGEHEGAIHDNMMLVNQHGGECPACVIGSPGQPGSVYLLLGMALSASVHMSADNAERLGRLLVAAAERSRQARPCERCGGGVEPWWRCGKCERWQADNGNDACEFCGEAWGAHCSAPCHSANKEEEVAASAEAIA